MYGGRSSVVVFATTDDRPAHSVAPTGAVALQATKIEVDICGKKHQPMALASNN
jgi:hypothetical protein